MFLIATMQDDPVNNHGSSGVAVAHEETRPRSDLTTGQLVDQLEWSYNEGLPFDADVVWELARRALASESRLGVPDEASSSQ